MTRDKPPTMYPNYFTQESDTSYVFTFKRVPHGKVTRVGDGWTAQTPDGGDLGLTFRTREEAAQELYALRRAAAPDLPEV